MNHGTKKITGAGGVSLFVQHWLPEGEAKAKVLLVHGYAEHSSRYAHFAEFLTGADYAVYAYDHRGHGLSSGKRAYIDRFSLLLKDLTAVFDWMRKGKEKKPVFLFGHSMGGAVVALYCLSRKPELQGVILSGAALQVSRDIAPLLQKFSSALGSLIPNVPTVKLNPEYISRDPEVVKAYIEDPLVYTERIYARTGAEMLDATRTLQGELDRFDYPVLILHGGDDKLAETEGSRRLYERAASNDKTLKVYPGAFHELVHETNREEVMADILDWLEQHLPDSTEPETD